MPSPVTPPLESADRSRGPRLPRPPVQRVLRPLLHFLELQEMSGFLLLACTVAALVVANSPWSAPYDAFWHLPAGLTIGGVGLQMSLAHWVNDGLMTIFFFVVGLEIKRELSGGELSDPRNAALPAAAALGGMLVPAGLYLLLEGSGPGARGWGVPMATDIAFVVGFLGLLGGRVPPGLKIFLLTLAIVDDIGAVLVIALFYTAEISWPALGLAAAGFGLIALLNRIGVRRVSTYVIVGTGIWVAFYKSGVHPTVAGVLLGILTPASAWVGEAALLDVLRDTLQHLGRAGRRLVWDDAELLDELRTSVHESVSPLERLETALHPWMALFIMPVFALANAGVKLRPEAALDSIALAVAAGLVVGKPVGIVFCSWLAVRSGLARLPSGVSWPALLGAGCLAGIGFTMSLFITGLALPPELQDVGKIGTLTGSTLSALLGFGLLWWALKPQGIRMPAEPA